MSNHSPISCDVIVIGGGVAGLSTAMQLAKRGSAVVVLERDQLGNGSSGRAAGLLGQLRGTAESTRMLMDGVEIVRELENQAEVEIYVQTGSLRIAETPERAQEIVDLVAMGKSIGFNIEHLTQSQVAEKLPYMKTSDLLDACYCPTDGHLQPAELVSAYIKVGRKHGVTYCTESPVTEVILEGGRAAGVRTAQAEYRAPVIVNAAGPWSYLVAGLTETVLPTAAICHHYLTTRPDEANKVDRFSPAVRDRHLRLYTRPESDGLIVGMYGAEATEYDMESLPIDFDMSSMKARLDDILVATLVYHAGLRFPWIDERTPMTMTTGIMTFTPDGKPFCGKLPDIEGLFHCAGFCGHGIVQSPTIGVIMADLILEGRTQYDIEAIEADRYFDLPELQSRKDIKSAAYEMHAGYYGNIEGGDEDTSE
ncbi:MAG: FAD-binding oxidoreductase [Planctomycetota bacterium]|nr:FAD-binding oxidoreductase [Planctomycetota bacterium]